MAGKVGLAHPATVAELAMSARLISLASLSKGNRAGSGKDIGRIGRDEKVSNVRRADGKDKVDEIIPVGDLLMAQRRTVPYVKHPQTDRIVLTTSHQKRFRIVGSKNARESGAEPRKYYGTSTRPHPAKRNHRRTKNGVLQKRKKHTSRNTTHSRRFNSTRQTSKTIVTHNDNVIRKHPHVKIEDVHIVEVPCPVVPPKEVHVTRMDHTGRPISCSRNGPQRVYW